GLAGDAEFGVHGNHGEYGVAWCSGRIAVAASRQWQRSRWLSRGDARWLPFHTRSRNLSYKREKFLSDPYPKACANGFHGPHASCVGASLPRGGAYHSSLVRARSLGGWVGAGSPSRHGLSASS